MNPKDLLTKARKAFDQGNFDRAETLCVEALRLNTNSEDSISQTTIDILNELALIYLEDSKMSKASTTLEQAQLVDLKVDERTVSSHIVLKNKLVKFECIKGDLKRASSFLHDAQDLYSRYETHCITVLPSLLEAIAIYQLSKESNLNLEVAYGSLAKAQEILENIQKHKTAEYISVLRYLIYVFYYQRAFLKAEKLCEEALACSRNVLGRKHPFYIDLLLCLASVRLQLADFSLSTTEEIAKQAINNELRGLRNNTRLARAYFTLSIIRAKQGRLATSKRSFTKALKAFEKTEPYTLRSGVVWIIDFQEQLRKLGHNTDFLNAQLTDTLVKADLIQSA